MKSDIVDLDVEIIARTDRAVLVHTGIKEAAAWLPLSQIEVAPSGFGGGFTISLPEWLAVEKGLV